MGMENTKTEFNSYAFLGWVMTLAVHSKDEDLSMVDFDDQGPPAQFVTLGMTDLGYRMDAAMRNGWALLNDVERGFCEEHMLPNCASWLIDMLHGTMRSKAIDT